MGLREEKKKKTREMILEKSYELFTDKGVSNVGMRELAQKCNLGIGTYYNYFKSKDEVVISLLVDKLNLALDALNIKRVLNSDQLLSVFKQLNNSRSIFESFIPIAMNIENSPHLKGLKTVIKEHFFEGKDLQGFYLFITAAHYFLENENEIDRVHFIKSII
ncbi:TetR/AcrR family transcriptional regulator [Bacteriovorax sp. Seq25_V]|uniref:TetR/AcrR family transcriptional regulator n=1 Tax=Bacteriovorax sp. Seq25_V TaxID=1201288 RepID=UPI00038A3E53|nr:TetR/AcrR family transcriptional regulator [Bacteriovorax sp. Seq25_V]EQC47304.1 transcriptional regulator, TetR family [Bacteriovorax sp. Seq25_V]